MRRRSALILATAAAAAPAAAQQQPPPVVPQSPGQVSPRLKGPPRIGERLAGTRWQAETVAGRPAVAEGRPTLEFLDDGFVRGDTGCNRFVGPFATRVDRVVMGPLSSTKRACLQPALARQEQALLQALERTERAELREEERVLLLFHATSAQPSRFVRTS